MSPTLSVPEKSTGRSNLLILGSCVLVICFACAAMCTDASESTAVQPAAASAPESQSASDTRQETPADGQAQSLKGQGMPPQGQGFGDDPARLQEMVTRLLESGYDMSATQAALDSGDTETAWSLFDQFMDEHQDAMPKPDAGAGNRTVDGQPGTPPGAMDGTPPGTPPA